jgi:hypothetical protein
VIVMIFEAVPHPDQKSAYFDAAAALRPPSEQISREPSMAMRSRRAPATPSDVGARRTR